MNGSYRTDRVSFGVVIVMKGLRVLGKRKEKKKELRKVRVMRRSTRE